MIMYAPKHNSVRLAGFLLIRAAFLVVIARASTIPCPGFSDPANFTSIPVNDRPTLATILQNGYRPMILHDATLPTTTYPGNPVQVLPQGFVVRPFRSFYNDTRCAEESTPGQLPETVRCAQTNDAILRPLNPANYFFLFEEQLWLESLASFAPPIFSTADNPAPPLTFDSSFVAWEDAIDAFLQQANCSDWIFATTYFEDYSCQANNRCYDLDPEFLADLNALPTDPISTTTVNDTLEEPYRAFQEKWGYGTVKNFGLGSAGLQVQLRNSSLGVFDTLYLGRAGGLGNWTEGENYLSGDDCLDPSPVNVVYEPWNEILQDLLFWLPTAVPNEDEIVDNFAALSLRDLLQTVSRNQLIRDTFPGTDCILASESSTTASEMPTPVPSMSPTTQPATKPTAAPSLRPSHSPIQMVSPTMLPTPTPSSSSGPRFVNSLPHTCFAISLLGIVTAAMAL